MSGASRNSSMRKGRSLRRVHHARHRQRSKAGIALLMVISAVTILTIVILEFSNTARLHLDAGVNLRDEMRANNMADTALVMSRACLDEAAWGTLAVLQNKVDMQKLCDLMLGIFIKGTVDLPLGGLSVPLEGISGVGFAKGEIEELSFVPEESYIGISGLYCETRADVACSSRVATVSKLRSLLCDPSIAYVFEHDQPDGKKYTRAEVIGNMIDWIDIDDNRINIDEANWSIAEGTGEGEDAYLRDSENRYRSKDAPFDSIEELRLIRGMSEDLFNFIKDKISVHSNDKVNINNASAEIIASLLQAYSPGFQRMEVSACGDENMTSEYNRKLFQNYARLIVDVRNTKQMMPTSMLSKPFKSAAAFVQVAKDPLTTLEGYLNNLGLLGGQSMDRQQMLVFRYGFPPGAYEAISADIDWSSLQSNVGVDNDLFRLRVKGRVGDMTRSLFAILKKDGKTVRTLYYRED